MFAQRNRLDLYSLSLTPVFETWNMLQNASRLVAVDITTHGEIWMSLCSVRFAGSQSKTPSRNTKATGLHWTFWWDCQTSNTGSTPDTYLLWPPSSIPARYSWRAVETVCSVLLETTPRIMPAWPQRVCSFFSVIAVQYFSQLERELTVFQDQVMGPWKTKASCTNAARQKLFYYAGFDITHTVKTFHHSSLMNSSYFSTTKFQSQSEILYHLESRWRNSYALVYHGPLLSHQNVGDPSTEFNLSLTHQNFPPLNTTSRRCWSQGRSKEVLPLVKRSQILLPSRGLTYPTLGKGKSSSKCHFWGICWFPEG